MDIQTALKGAIIAASQDDLQTAQQILKTILQQDPRSVSAWLLLADVVEDPDHARQCFERVLQLEPGNQVALNGLAQLDDPFSGLNNLVAAAAPASEAVPPEHPAARLEAQTVKPVVELVPQVESPQPAAGQKPQRPVPQGETAQPAAAQKPRRTAPKQQKKAQPQKKSSRWLEFSLLGVVLVCACVVGFVLIGQNPSLLQLQPTPPLESPTAVIYRNMETANNEDLDGYMDTIHPRASGRLFTRSAMKDLFDRYDLYYRVSGLRVLEQTEDEARVAFTLTTQKVSGPAFRDNRLTGVMILRLDGREWKIYNQEVGDVIYLN